MIPDVAIDQGVEPSMEVMKTEGADTDFTPPLVQRPPDGTYLTAAFDYAEPIFSPSWQNFTDISREFYR